MTVTLLLFLAGLGLLVLGAEWLIRSASRLAATLGLEPLLIGLTVVAYGTSAPEMAVSVKSALAGQPDIALGNVVGSNICNVLLVLGVSATVAPLRVASRIVRIDVPILVGVSLLMLVLAADGSIGRLDGALLLAGSVAYTAFQVRQSRREPRAVVEEYAAAQSRRGTSTALDLLWIVAGLVLLVLGSRWLVGGAVAFARQLGVSELVVGLTIVAAGTSLPEVATSVLAGLRGERDIAVGNVIGSSIFNILTVLGLGGLVAPAGLPAATALLRFDAPVMIAVAVACLPIFASGGRINRWEGLLFLAYYGAYTAYLIRNAQEHEALPALSAIMGVFVLPLTALTLGIMGWRAWKHPEPRG